MSKANNYLLGSAKEAISFGANSLMIYTGAPQNTKRADTSLMHIKEGQDLLAKNNIDLKSIIIHAPYIVNLANGDLEKRKFAIEFLKNEYKRTYELGSKIMVLHPGNHLKNTPKQAMDWIIEGLNQIIDPKLGVLIALETMAGKGTEVGRSFEEIQYMLKGVKHQDLVGVCFDTCHVWDSGYDIKNNLNEVLEEFDNIVGLEKISVLHINDSKNDLNSKKDRHENIDKGFIGLKAILDIVWHPKLNGLVKILETPFIEKKAPYKEEIKLLKGNL